MRRTVDVNARNVFGESALHDAVLGGNPELVALLLEFGADPGAVDDNALRLSSWQPAPVATVW